MKTRAAIFGLLLFLGSSAFADCIYEGQSYPEGTRIGPYVCEGGRWVVK